MIRTKTKTRVCSVIFAPDDYYPVYGDASAKGFDAQSSKKFYVRLDKDRSFVMYGDLKTHIDNNDGLSLGQYDRTLTGIKSHYENDTTKVTAFVAKRAQANASMKRVVWVFQVLTPSV
ncbi:hypothetical protein, partial [Moraxella atlantae]|uniref:hypothetical protein n=1 Tax=Faucicola atlantae TaxID=34059 RepID=UPI0011C04C29